MHQLEWVMEDGEAHHLSLIPKVVMRMYLFNGEYQPNFGKPQIMSILYHDLGSSSVAGIQSQMEPEHIMTLQL